MAITNIHPHVGVTVNAAKRKAVVAEEPKVPVLFAPFVSNRGPIGISYKTNGGVLKCYSNAEFISIYGDLEFKEQGQQVLNIGNWLENGGGVLPVRMWKAPTAESTNRLTSATLSVLTIKTGELFAINGNIESSNHATFDTANDPINPDYYCAFYQGNAVQARAEKCSATETYDATVTYYSQSATTAAGAVSCDGKFYIPQTGLSASSDLKDYYKIIAASCPIVVRAKNPGSFYYGVYVSIEKTGDGVFNIIVKDANSKEVERFTRKTVDNYTDVAVASDYVGVICFSESLIANLNSYDRTLGTARNTYTVQLKYSPLGANDTLANFASKFDNTFNDSMVLDALDLLEDRLQIKCDYILDAGYSAITKKGIVTKLYDKGNKGSGLFRDDIIFLADSYVSNFANNLIPTLPTNALNTESFNAAIDLSRVVLFDQYLTTEDVYSRTGNTEVYVTPTYFLAGLVPANEIRYGAFYPNAGKTRAVISGAKSLNYNPRLTRKDELTRTHMNYIEKDSNSMQFMQQYTLETENTALKWWNNVRCVNKMSREIEDIGRWYLFEDTTDSTLRNLQNAIEKYMNNWILGRALKKCIVEVYADENDDTLVHVLLHIQFNGTIEIISVEINLD